VERVFDADGSQPPDLLLDPPVAPSPRHRGSTRAGTPGDDPVTAELARLRRRVSQQDEALVHMAKALVALRRGSEALRAENRELRAELAAAQS
jgi:hypothetical protein